MRTTALGGGVVSVSPNVTLRKLSEVSSNISSQQFNIYKGKRFGHPKNILRVTDLPIFRHVVVDIVVTLATSGTHIRLVLDLIVTNDKAVVFVVIFDGGNFGFLFFLLTSQRVINDVTILV